MASSLLDICRFTPTAGGTTDWTYSSAVTGYQSPSAANVISGNTYSYRAESSDLTQWEIGVGAYSAGVLARTTVLYNSSGTTAKISFSATPQVAIVALLEDFTTSAGSGWALPNCTLAASVSSNLLTVALKDNQGNDPSASSPVFISYRSATAATGSVTVVPQTAALSISTNATGASLGSSNSTAFRFWVVCFNNSGTNVLALINCSTSTRIYTLDETQVASSTAISASATSAGVFYTPNGTTVTSKSFRILGYVEYNATGLATAGTYASGPNFIQAFGPGIKKPGDVIQSLYMTNTSETTATSTTKVQTSTTLTITPTSATNLIRADARGSLRVSSNAIVANSQISRGAGPTMIGSIGACFCDGTGVTTVYSAASMFALDKPNTASAQAYYVYVWSSGSGNSTWDPTAASSQAMMILDEVMG